MYGQSDSTKSGSSTGKIRPIQGKPPGMKRYSMDRKHPATTERSERVWSAKGQGTASARNPAPQDLNGRTESNDKVKGGSIKREGAAGPPTDKEAESMTQQFGGAFNLNDEKVPATNQSREFNRRRPMRGHPGKSRPGSQLLSAPTFQTPFSFDITPQAHRDEERYRERHRRDPRHSAEDQDSQEGSRRSKKLSLAEFHSAVAGADEDKQDETPSRILWVGNIGPDVSDDELLQEFRQFGKIESLRILHDRYCAFVNFEDEECAQKAKEELNNTIVGSQYIVINYRKPEMRHPVALSLANSPLSTEDNFILNNPSRALWIGNISNEVNETDLMNEFQQFGDIESIRLLRDKTCAFVNFMTIEEATSALYALQGKVMGNMAIKINFGKPQPPPKRLSGLLDPMMFQPPFQPFFQPDFPYPMPYAPVMQAYMPGMPMEGGMPFPYFMPYPYYVTPPNENGTTPPSEQTPNPQEQPGVPVAQQDPPPPTEQQQ